MMNSHDYDPHRYPESGSKYGKLSGLEAGKRGYLPAKVLLDGKEITDCIEFDDVEGWADVYARENGQIVANENGDGPKLKRLFGQIDYLPFGTYE